LTDGGEFCGWWVFLYSGLDAYIGAPLDYIILNTKEPCFNIASDFSVGDNLFIVVEGDPGGFYCSQYVAPPYFWVPVFTRYGGFVVTE